MSNYVNSGSNYASGGTAKQSATVPQPMSTCPHCGSINPPGAKYCSACGRQLYIDSNKFWTGIIWGAVTTALCLIVGAGIYMYTDRHSVDVAKDKAYPAAGNNVAKLTDTSIDQQATIDSLNEVIQSLSLPEQAYAPNNESGTDTIVVPQNSKLSGTDSLNAEIRRLKLSISEFQSSNLELKVRVKALNKQLDEQKNKANNLAKENERLQRQVESLIKQLMN